jgi:hypothetical protein
MLCCIFLSLSVALCFVYFSFSSLRVALLPPSLSLSLSLSLTCLLLVACLIFSPEEQAHEGFGGSYPLSERPRKVSPFEARTYPAVIIEPGFGTRAG